MGNIEKKASGAVVTTEHVDLSNGAPEDLCLWNQEEAILDTTELVCELMQKEGVSRSDLARRMGKTKSYISQILDGSRNMTIRTVSDLLTNLGHKFRASCAQKESEQGEKTATVRMVAVEFTVPHHSNVIESPTTLGAHTWSLLDSWSRCDKDNPPDVPGAENQDQSSLTVNRLKMLKSKTTHTRHG